MEIKVPIIIHYKVTWHDTLHDGACFDEDDFYSMDDLIKYLKYSKESIEDKHDDIMKVWAVLFDGQMVEIVNTRRNK